MCQEHLFLDLVEILEVLGLLPIILKAVTVPGFPGSLGLSELLDFWVLKLSGDICGEERAMVSYAFPS
jgi:hypothetical protein